ncbi:MAG: efflux RND transporter periplasmic adaptor subunit [Sphingobacteriia bacterium]|nr:MAG: efflux RND transporter periplasmic adaptor subunit [Sphingobacteriia bacterium]TAG31639.1 MAG: efflux RND transporter periplasmic adaptor subunit [Sphingobacteriia bacterium]
MKFKYRIANSLQSVVVCTICMCIIACSNKSIKKQEIKEKYTVINPIIADSNYIQEYVAEIQAIQNVELRARVKGFIEKLYVDEGKTVSQGQLLFSLNCSEYKQEILKAKAQLAVAQAELKQAEVEIKSATILTENNVVSRAELELAKSKKEAVLAKIQEANATIKLANLNLSFTEIKAPFSGVINRIPNKVGALIEEGALLTSISNNTEMYVYFNVSENDYLKYITQNTKNNIVQLKLSNGNILPQKGIIETIDGEINPATGNLSFRAKFPNTQKWLKHGSSGKILVSNILSKAILIPQQSTFDVQENLYVYVVNEKNIVEQRKIIPQMRLANMYVVKEGLSAKDKVLYDGVQLVKEGDAIIPELKDFNQISKPQKQQ